MGLFSNDSSFKSENKKLLEPKVKLVKIINRT